MKRPSKKKIIEALKTAKEHLHTYESLQGPRLYSKSSFICVALDYAGEAGRWVADNVIMKRLDGQYTLEYWAEWKFSRDILAMSPSERCKAMQDYRHRWVDALIKEFSK